MSIVEESVAPSAESAALVPEELAAARQQRLTKGIASLRVRSQVPLDRVLLIAGSVLLPLGALFILLGWYGASHTPDLFEQIPYLISGGLLGVAFVGAGGFFYFGYWLTRQVYEARGQNEQLVAALTRIETQLQASADAAAAGVSQPAGSATGGRRAASNGRSRAARTVGERNGSADPGGHGHRNDVAPA